MSTITTINPRHRVGRFTAVTMYGKLEHDDARARFARMEWWAKNLPRYLRGRFLHSHKNTTLRQHRLKKPIPGPRSTACSPVFNPLVRRQPLIATVEGSRGGSSLARRPTNRALAFIRHQLQVAGMELTYS